MDSVADLIISELDVCLDKLGLTLIAHERALDEYVAMFKATRKQELEEIKMRRKLKASYYPGLLLIVHKKTRSISTKKYMQSDYDEVDGKRVLFSQLNLAIVTRGYSDYIPSERNGQYRAKRVLRFNNLRAYSDEDKEWVTKVVEDVNQLNRSGQQIRDAYLSMAECHHEALKRYDLKKMGRTKFVDHDKAGR
jgi:hypothetical protein